MLTMEDVRAENERLRRMNRILRAVNGGLRRRVTVMAEGSDGLFLALCESYDGAEVLGEPWGSGADDCGPRGHDGMADTGEGSHNRPLWPVISEPVSAPPKPSQASGLGAGEGVRAVGLRPVPPVPATPVSRCVR